jgi:hypothetical protein
MATRQYPPFALCTPVMGVKLWGENPLYENLEVFINTNKSTSRRQGRLCVEGSCAGHSHLCKRKITTWDVETTVQ